LDYRGRPCQKGEEGGREGGKRRKGKGREERKKGEERWVEVRQGEGKEVYKPP
jgi:hypothetical protein